MIFRSLFPPYRNLKSHHQIRFSRCIRTIITGPAIKVEIICVAKFGAGWHTTKGESQLMNHCTHLAVVFLMPISVKLSFNRRNSRAFANKTITLGEWSSSYFTITTVAYSVFMRMAPQSGDFYAATIGIRTGRWWHGHHQSNILRKIYSSIFVQIDRGLLEAINCTVYRPLVIYY